MCAAKSAAEAAQDALRQESDEVVSVSGCYNEEVAALSAARDAQHAAQLAHQSSRQRMHDVLMHECTITSELRDELRERDEQLMTDILHNPCNALRKELCRCVRQEVCDQFRSELSGQSTWPGEPRGGELRRSELHSMELSMSSAFSAKARGSVEWQETSPPNARSASTPSSSSRSAGTPPNCAVTPPTSSPMPAETTPNPQTGAAGAFASPLAPAAAQPWVKLAMPTAPIGGFANLALLADTGAGSRTNLGAPASSSRSSERSLEDSAAVVLQRVTEEVCNSARRRTLTPPPSASRYGGI